MAQIHPTAVVDPRAQLDDTVTIGPYAVIGPDVRIGAGTTVGPHCVIEGRTTIGRDNRFFQFSSIGAMPQDIWQDATHRGEVTQLVIGDREALMKEGGVIACDAPRHPFPALQPAVRSGLLEVARRVDPMVLRWGR